MWRFFNPPPNFWRFFAYFFIYPSVVFEKLLSREGYPITENQKMNPAKTPKSVKIDVLNHFKSKIPFAKFKKVPFFGKSLKKTTFFGRIFNLATGICTKTLENFDLRVVSASKTVQITIKTTSKCHLSLVFKNDKNIFFEPKHFFPTF